MKDALLSGSSPSNPAPGPAPSAAGRGANQVDDCVGERIRHRRLELGWTQFRLACKLGISYQQVQKYETATNRISAGRLHQIAVCLEVGVGYFFEHAAASSAAPTLPHGGKDRMTIELVRNFTSISNDPLRAALSGLTKALSEAG